MKRILKSLFRDTRGATTIEYGLICGMIVLAIIGAVRGLGSESGGTWTNMSSKAVAAMKSTS
jgi:pilus assembly protein Flp/PilA